MMSDNDSAPSVVTSLILINHFTGHFAGIFLCFRDVPMIWFPQSTFSSQYHKNNALRGMVDDITENQNYLHLR